MLQVLRCNGTGISYLDLTNNAELTYLSCGETNLSKLDVSLSWAAVSSRISAPAKAKGDGYTVDLGALVGRENRERIVFVSAGEYDAATGLVTFETLPTDFTYNYDFHNDYTRERSLTVVVDVRFRSVWRSVLLWAISVVVLVPTVILLAVHLRRKKEKAQ